MNCTYFLPEHDDGNNYDERRAPYEMGEWRHVHKFLNVNRHERYDLPDCRLILPSR